MALTTFADLVGEVREKVIEDIRRGGWPGRAEGAGTDADVPNRPAAPNHISRRVNTTLKIMQILSQFI